MISMNYEQAIEFITSKSNFYIDLSLNRITLALNELGNPQKDLRFIHVAGTNGKGSVCSMLASILQQAGYKVGLYTSPHIWEYTERIKVNGIEIPKEIFAENVQKISTLGIHLTEFEILTVVMFLYFKSQNVDLVILETGLGGRLDATNVIEKNLCSIITHIDLDHTERLGNTKEKIAYEKAGIIKQNCPIITSEGYEVIKDRADSMNSLFILASPYVKQEFIDALSLKGNHQIENLALVTNAINYLFKNIDDNTIIEGLKRVKNPFRFEYFHNKNLIVDASHNPNGIMALKENLDFYFPNIPRRFVFGCLRNKDYKRMMQILFTPDDEIYFNEFDYPNATSYNELSSVCIYPAKKYDNEVIIQQDKLNVICGSFYMIGGMKWLKSLQV